MKENVLDVIMYLFENYMEDEPAQFPDRDSLSVKLLEAGFTSGEIDKALNWLEELAEAGGRLTSSAESRHSLRLYSESEMQVLDTECRGFLTFLEQMGILSPRTRELVIDRVMALDSEDMDLERLKWVILLVLFNQPGEEAAYAWMEDLVFESFSGYLQ